MFQIALFEPEIPPNTGNIIRLCANTGSALHLIEPLGFSLDDRGLKRAGLDYHQYAFINTYSSYDKFSEATVKKRVFALSTHATSDFFAALYCRAGTADASGAALTLEDIHVAAFRALLCFLDGCGFSTLEPHLEHCARTLSATLTEAPTFVREYCVANGFADFTVEDPTVWTAPFTGEYAWPRTEGKVFEYACHEANYSFGGIMRGARLLEAEFRGEETGGVLSPTR